MLAWLSDHIALWLLDGTTLAIVSWIGTVIGLLGLLATYLQARAARKAAEQAATTVAALHGRLSLSNVAYSYSQIGALKSLVHSGSLPAAQMIFQPLKRDILEVCHMLSGRDALQGEIEVIRHAVRLAERQLDIGSEKGSAYKPRKLMQALSGLSDFLAARENELKLPLAK